MDSNFTSADFLPYSTNDLIEELHRRAVTIVMAIEVEGEGSMDEEDYINRIKFHHAGDPFARVGLSDLLSTHIRRTSRSILETMEETGD